MTNYCREIGIYEKAKWIEESWKKTLREEENKDEERKEERAKREVLMFILKNQTMSNSSFAISALKEHTVDICWWVEIQNKEEKKERYKEKGSRAWSEVLSQVSFTIALCLVFVNMKIKD